MGSLPAPEINRWPYLDSRCQELGDMHMSNEGCVLSLISGPGLLRVGEAHHPLELWAFSVWPT